MLLDSVTLDMRQSELLDKILTRYELNDTAPERDKQGLSVYQNNVLFTATRALNICYPVVTQLVGEQVMYALANLLLQKHPPTTGNLADWGEQLANIIASTSLDQSYPFLSDVAALEWVIHEVGRKRLEPVTKAMLEKVQLEGFLSARLALSSTAYLLESVHPIDAIWKIHQDGFANQKDYSQTFERLIEEHHGACRLLIYQKNRKPEMVKLLDNDFEWMRDVEKNLTVTRLLTRHSSFDFVHWLSRAVKENWVRISF